MAREVYGLIGQSNMAGMATSPAQTYANQARIFSFGLTTLNDPNCLTRAWGPASDPLHKVGGGIGPGMAFADKLIDLRGEPSLEIGLIPCAWEGSSSAQWKPTWRPFSNFYGGLLRALNQAKAWGEIRGIVVNQGETDAMGSPGCGMVWLENWMRVVQALRADLNMPELPFIFTSIITGEPVYFPQTLEIQTRANEIALMRMPNVRVVSSSDLPRFDAIHLTAAAAVTLGHRYAQKMHDIQMGVPEPNPPVWLTGSRPYTVTASSGLLTPSADPGNLVDGALAGNPTDSTWFPGSVAVAGKYIDFAFPVPLVIDGMRWRQWAADSHIYDTHGIWQASIYDGSAWIDLGTNFTLGGQAAQEVLFPGNTVAATNFRLTGISGSTSGHPYVNEVEFRTP